MSESDEIEVRLSKNEALVLFEFLSRFSDRRELLIEDQSEERVLWNVCCLLEKTLTEPFRADYDNRIAEARSALRDSLPGDEGEG